MDGPAIIAKPLIILDKIIVFVNRGLMREFKEQRKTYSDGITYIIDPFWLGKCRKCGYEYLSCMCTGTCPKCGNDNIEYTLGGRSLEEIIAERRPDLIRDNQSKSE